MRLRTFLQFLGADHFNPRTPGGVRPLSLAGDYNAVEYFNPRTPGGVRPRIPAQYPLH